MTVPIETLIFALTFLIGAGEPGISASELASQMNTDTPTAIQCLKELHRLNHAVYVPHPGIEIRMRAKHATEQKQE